MKTRQHLNETALSLARLLGMIRGMTDAEIDDIMDNDEVRCLADDAHSLCEYTEKQKNA